jgi:hypothetical protein
MSIGCPAPFASSTVIASTSAIDSPRTVTSSVFSSKVMRLKDRALVLTFERFAGSPVDEHAARLRNELGSRLDAHDDKRGILFFSDVCEPSGQTYNAIVREIGTAGKWGLASRIAAWVAGEPPLFKPGARARKAPSLTKPGETGYDADVAEMIRLFGGDERSWKDVLNPNPVAATIATATRPKKKTAR